MYTGLNKDKGFLYESLCRQIREKITKKEIKAGDRLPSIRSLARDLKISINTVKQSYYQLELEGYIESKDRAGFFCREIDHLIVLDGLDLKSKSKEKKEDILYDFSFSGVDLENFPFATWRKMLKDSVSQGDESLTERGHYKGYLPLRMAIADYVKKSRDIVTKADNIIISSGTESLFHLVKNLLGPSILYAFENPGYAFGNKFFTYDLVNPIPLPLDDQGVKIDSIHDINACCLFVTPHHQFPMGTAMSIQRRVELLNWAAGSTNRYIIEDDYEAEFKFRGSPIAALKSMDKNDDVIYIGSFSKLISPALRISYMILPEKLLYLFEENFVSLGCPVSLYTQKATANFISQGYFERHINRMKNVYSIKYDYITDLLEDMKAIDIVSRGSSLVIVIKVNKALDSKAFLLSLKKKGVIIRPVNDFSYGKAADDKMYILGFASLTKEEIQKGLEIIEQTLERAI